MKEINVILSERRGLGRIRMCDCDAINSASAQSRSIWNRRLLRRQPLSCALRSIGLPRSRRQNPKASAESTPSVRIEANSPTKKE